VLPSLSLRDGYARAWAPTFIATARRLKLRSRSPPARWVLSQCGQFYSQIPQQELYELQRWFRCAQQEHFK
jgi:hypothetical protein